jgi:hypothetical protein
VAVIVKHRMNLIRLISNTENRLKDRPMRPILVKMLHLLALGTWFGGAAFFQFGTALPIFDSFRQVVAEGPSSRTAYVRIVPEGTDETTQANLANALAGAAVGPVFPRFFAMQAICGLVALVTALTWWPMPGSVHKWRVAVLGLAVLLVAVSWPLSAEVSTLRVQRFDPDPAIAAQAKDWFGPMHLASLLLSLLTTTLAGMGLALAATLPANTTVQQEP